MLALCKCTCWKVALLSASWLCSWDNATGRHDYLRKHGCPRENDYAYVETTDACSQLNGNVCEGWEAIWDEENAWIVDWVFTHGKLRACKNADL